MDSGKVSESVLKRSVLKYVQQNNKSVENKCHLIQEAKVGADASLFAVSGEDVIGSATAVAVGRNPMVAVESIINACNNLICSGAEAFGVQIGLVLPEAMYESELRHVMEAAKVYAAEQQLLILGGHTTASKYVTETIATVTALGTKANSDSQALRPGMDVVMSKWIGLQGTAKIAKEQKEALLQRLPARFIAEAASYDKYMSVVPEAKVAWKEGTIAMHDVSGGGIFRALWELAERAETGIRIDLKKIPVKQESIEICEVFGLNPYELLSGGALLMVAEDGDVLVEKLAQEGISAAVIGRLTDDNDRVIVTRGEDGEELRYLDRPRTDEIDKI
jgi:hydrogenase maturation factor